jgi:CBS domain-containing protein
MVTASQLMKRTPILVSATATFLEAAQIMRNRGIGSVLVEQGGQIVGIVTETDIVREVVGMGQMPGFVRVSRIMSSPVIGIDERRPITEAADLMERHRTRHLAVFQDGRIVGVLSVRDLLHPVAVDEF